MADKPVVVYGASGYTGRLVCADLASRKIPFVAAGRNKKRLDEFIAELKGADVEAVQVDNDRAALAKLFQGSKVVISVAGPFLKLGKPVAEAALDAKCHYMDTTGEQEFMMEIQKDLGDKFQKQERVMISACAMVWSVGTLACEVALETEGIDSVKVLTMPIGGVQTVASLQSMMRFWRRPRYRLENGESTLIPKAEKTEKVTVPGTNIEYDAPVASGGEPTWFLNDPRVKNTQTLFGVASPMVDAWINLQEFIPFDMMDRWSDEYVLTIKQTPPQEDPKESKFTVVAWGTGNGVTSRAVLQGQTPYITTGHMCAESAQRCLEGKVKKTGYVSAAQAFGHREMIKSMDRVGCHLEEG